MDLHALWGSRVPPLSAGIGIVAEQLPLLRVDRNDGAFGGQRLADFLVDELKSGIPIGRAEPSSSFQVACRL